MVKNLSSRCLLKDCAWDCTGDCVTPNLDAAREADATGRTSLDAPETSERGYWVDVAFQPERDTHPADTMAEFPAEPYQTWRHSGWLRQRTGIYAALRDVGTSDASLRRFRECGTHAHVVQSLDNPGLYRIAYHCCHSRWCLPCANSRSRAIAGNLGVWLKGKRARFVTLTLQATDDSLASRLALLDKSWAGLKRSDLWRRTQTGGVAFLEVKIRSGTGRWHPHLHILTTGRYLDQSLLKHVWANLTGGSTIVHVQAVRVPEKAVSYAAKYASKPLDSSVLGNQQALREAIPAMHGVRTVRTYGNCKGLQMTAALDAQAWEYVAPLHTLLQRVREGDEHALAILESVIPDDLSHLLVEAKRRLKPGHAPPVASLCQLEFLT